MKLLVARHDKKVWVTDDKNGRSLMSNHWLMKAVSLNCASVKLLSVTSPMISRTVATDGLRFWVCNKRKKIGC